MGAGGDLAGRPGDLFRTLPRSPSSISASLRRRSRFCGGRGEADGVRELLLSLLPDRTASPPPRDLDACLLLRPRSSPLVAGVSTAELGGCKVFLRLSSSPQWVIITASFGQSSSSTSTLLMRSSVSWPDTSLPKTVCLPFRWSQGASVMKNLEGIGISFCDG
jgi:hypothetical protein